MTKVVQRRGLTTAQLATTAASARELIVDTDKKTVVVMDGVTNGGFPLAKENKIEQLNSSLTISDTGANGALNLLLDGVNRMTASTNGEIVSSLGGMQVISGTAVAATGTAIDFLNIPSWVKKFTLTPHNVSTNGTSPFLVQIGDAGGIEITGYTSYGVSMIANGIASAGSTVGFLLIANVQAALSYGAAVTLYRVSGNNWTFSSNLASGGQAGLGAGFKTLDAPLDRVRFTTLNGTDVFDAGTVNYLYE